MDFFFFLYYNCTLVWPFRKSSYYIVLVILGCNIYDLQVYHEGKQSILSSPLKSTHSLQPVHKYWSWIGLFSCWFAHILIILPATWPFIIFKSGIWFFWASLLGGCIWNFGSLHSLKCFCKLPPRGWSQRKLIFIPIHIIFESCEISFSFQFILLRALYSTFSFT